MRLAVIAACSSLLFACSNNDNNGGFACTNGVCPSGYKCVTENGAQVCRPGTPTTDTSTPVGDNQIKTEGQTPDPCAAAADGTDCSSVGGTGFICIKKKCASSTCGDSYVDTKSEDCDDGNTVSDDGCDACKYNCKTDTDCDDKNPCNGVETCDTTAHKCKAGTTADGKDCTLTGGATGVCNGGTCAPKGCGNKIVDGTEECDDGNKTDGDGCNNDCTYSCHKDADCDDKNVCTGSETCDTASTHMCKAGTALTCDDKCECTNDSCDPVKGCVYTGIDLDKDGHIMKGSGCTGCGDDCNDADPAIFPGAIDCADGKDNDCNPATADGSGGGGKCWADSDGDTFATTTAATISQCTCPAGYTNKDPATAGADCKEGVADVHPGQSTWFTKTYCAGKITCTITGGCTCTLESWDYNCSKVNEQQYTDLAAACTKCIGKFCFLTCGDCCGSGWVGTTVPACGVTASWQNCSLNILGNCAPSIKSTTRTQGCH